MNVGAGRKYLKHRLIRLRKRNRVSCNSAWNYQVYRYPLIFSEDLTQKQECLSNNSLQCPYFTELDYKDLYFMHFQNTCHFRHERNYHTNFGTKIVSVILYSSDNKIRKLKVNTSTYTKTLYWNRWYNCSCDISCDISCSVTDAAKWPRHCWMEPGLSSVRVNIANDGVTIELWYDPSHQDLNCTVLSCRLPHRSRLYQSRIIYAAMDQLRDAIPTPMIKLMT